MSLRLDAAGSEPAGGQQQYQDRYRRSLILLSKFAIHMRMSDGLADQEYSDRIERWLVKELVQPDRKKLFADDEYSTIVTALADRTGRQQARRRAIVVAWKQACDGHSGFGGLSLPAVSTKSMAAFWLVTERNAGQACAVLLDYLESKDRDSDRFPAEILAFWPGSAAQFEEAFADVSLDSVSTPGALWHQDWENKAVQLFNSLK